MRTIFLAPLAMMLVAATDAPLTDSQIRDMENGEFLWKYYPPGALKRGEEGRVSFKLTIEPTGTISGCQVTKGSGFNALDLETCEIMGLYAHVKPVRDSDGRAIRAERTGFINWKLPAGAVKVATASVGKPMAKSDRMVCRKDVTTGSLIATTRMCKPASEWDRSSEEQKQHWKEMQGSGFTNGSVPTGG